MVVASHQFSDVPTSHLFHADISWLASTGITSGCGGGKFCPESAVTRGQMAKFMHKLVNVTRTSSYACSAFDFFPSTNNTGYTTTSGRRSTTVLASGPVCGVHVPDGAVVTKLTSVVYDVDVSAGFSCNLNRLYLTGSLGTIELMASTPFTSNDGNQTLTDTSILNSTIDNDAYGYYVGCGAGGDSETGVYGAIVEYTTVGVPAP